MADVHGKKFEIWWFLFIFIFLIDLTMLMANSRCFLQVATLWLGLGCFLPFFYMPFIVCYAIPLSLSLF